MNESRISKVRNHNLDLRGLKVVSGKLEVRGQRSENATSMVGIKTPISEVEVQGRICFLVDKHIMH